MNSSGKLIKFESLFTKHTKSSAIIKIIFGFCAYSFLFLLFDNEPSMLVTINVSDIMYRTIIFIYAGSCTPKIKTIENIYQYLKILINVL